jgi:hypothetical protein
MHMTLRKPADAVRTMLEGLAEEEKFAQEALAQAQGAASFAAEEVSKSLARLDAVRAAIIEWRSFQRQHCE